MKNLFFLSACFFFSLNSLFSEIHNLKFDVEGMSCSVCVYSIEKNSKKIEALQSLRFDQREGKLLVALKEGSSFNYNIFKELIVDSGFVLKKVELDFSANLRFEDDRWIVNSSVDGTEFSLHHDLTADDLQLLQTALDEEKMLKISGEIDAKDPNAGSEIWLKSVEFL